jgi:excisionase family DNA binding protein
MAANYLTTRKAAKLLGISVRTAQQWVEKGQLEGWKTDGGHRRISHSSVSATLAARPTAALAKQEPAAVPILIVEDEANLLRLYRMHTERWPFKTTIYTAPNGYEALVLAGEVKPQLLICDLRLPGVNGFQIVRALCEMQRFKHMGIVVVSGLTVPEIQAHGGVPERVEILGKPIDFARLQEIAKQYCERPAAPVVSGE